MFQWVAHVLSETWWDCMMCTHLMSVLIDTDSTDCTHINNCLAHHMDHVLQPKSLFYFLPITFFLHSRQNMQCIAKQWNEARHEREKNNINLRKPQQFWIRKIFGAKEEMQATKGICSWLICSISDEFRNSL